MKSKYWYQYFMSQKYAFLLKVLYTKICTFLSFSYQYKAQADDSENDVCEQTCSQAVYLRVRLGLVGEGS